MSHMGIVTYKEMFYLTTHSIHFIYGYMGHTKNTECIFRQTGHHILRHLLEKSTGIRWDFEYIRIFIFTFYYFYGGNVISGSLAGIDLGSTARNLDL